jgi:hypothetical protein
MTPVRGCSPVPPHAPGATGVASTAPAVPAATSASFYSPGSATAAARAIATASPARPGSGFLPNSGGFAQGATVGTPQGSALNSMSPSYKGIKVAADAAASTAATAHARMHSGQSLQEVQQMHQVQQTEVALPSLSGPQLGAAPTPLGTSKRAPLLLTVKIKVPKAVAEAGAVAAAVTAAVRNAELSASGADVAVPMSATLLEESRETVAAEVSQPAVSMFEDPGAAPQIQVNANGVETDPSSGLGSASGSTLPMLTPQFSFGDNDHVTIWNRIERRKIAGNAAPLGRNVYRYLDQHADCEVYYNQDKADAAIVSGKKRSRAEQEHALAGDHVPIWNKREKRKIAGNAAPLHKNLEKYLAARPDCETYRNQDHDPMYAGEGALETGGDYGENDRGCAAFLAATMAANEVASIEAPAPELDLDAEPSIDCDLSGGTTLKVCPLTGEELTPAAPSSLLEASGRSIAPVSINVPGAESFGAIDVLGSGFDVNDWPLFGSDIPMKTAMETATEVFLQMSIPGGEQEAVHMTVLSGPVGMEPMEPALDMDVDVDDDLGLEVDDLQDVLGGDFEASANDLVL